MIASVYRNEDSQQGSDTNEEKCFVCGHFYPDEINEIDYLQILKWGQLEKCTKMCTTLLLLKNECW